MMSCSMEIDKTLASNLHQLWDNGFNSPALKQLGKWCIHLIKYSKSDFSNFAKLKDLRFLIKRGREAHKTPTWKIDK